MEAYRLEQFQGWSEYMMSALDDPQDPVRLVVLFFWKNLKGHLMSTQYRP